MSFNVLRNNNQQSVRFVLPTTIFFTILMVILQIHFALANETLSLNINDDQVDLTSLDIEELMDINITSVGKKSQTLSSSASAIYVITDEDIRTSGVTSIPDALRMVPGLHVARISSDKWAINSRGAGGMFSDKLLVLIDGRSVYSPTFSGVYWEIQDTMLADIERIEVIRGPGATLWGANAVNGVINIITKKSQDTQGGLLEAGGGDFEKNFVSARYGTHKEQNYGRIYAKGFKREGLKGADGQDFNNGWDVIRGGFRTDTDLNNWSSFTFQGDIYKENLNQYMESIPSINPPYFYKQVYESDSSGANLLAKWQKIISSSSEISLQAYYDRTSRNEVFLNEERDTLDFEFQHRFSPFSDNDVVWGLRLNYTHDQFDDTFIISFEDDERKDYLFSSFIQDEIAIVPEKIWVTFGSKLDHNNYSGYEFQPSTKFMWVPHESHKLWGSVSRAVRTPTRIEHDGQLVQKIDPPFTLTFPQFPYTNILPIVFHLKGSKSFDSEELIAYEAGYRFLPTTYLSFDFALFYNDYNRLRAFEVGELILHDNYADQLIIANNNYEGTTYGAELSAAWKASELLKLDFAYSYIMSEIDNRGQIGVGSPSKHRLSLRGNFKPARVLDVNLWLRYVDDVKPSYLTKENSVQQIDSYIELDANLVWTISKSMDFSIVGQNLLNSSHMEALQDSWIYPVEMVRGFYGKVTWHF